MRGETPGESIPPSASGVFRRLLGDCLEHRRAIVAAVLSMLGLSASQLYLTWLAKRWVEEGLVPRNGAAILRLSITSGAVATIMVAMLFSSTYLLARINQGMVTSLRARMQRRLLAMELSAIRRFPNGEIVSRLFNDCAALSGFAEAVLKRVIGEGFLVAGAITMLFVLEWRLALTVLLAGPPIGWLVATLGRVIRRRGAHAQRELGRLTALFGEQLRGASTIKGFGGEAFEGERFRRQNDAHRDGVLRGEWWSSAMLAGVWLATSLALVAVVAYGGRMVASGHLTEGIVLSFCLYAVQTIEPARRLGEVYGRLQRTLASAERVYEIIDLAAVERSGELSPPHPTRGEVRLERVSFRYRPDRAVLDDVTVTIRPGERVAVVAASGGGKTTLASLLARFQDPTRGRVLLDGCDVRDLRLEDLRRAVCIVEQDPFVFGGTVLDNVRYGSWTASRESVEAAVGRAGLGAWLAEIPGGLEAVLAEGGHDLSGGQKSRLALARAIIRDPRVLILDETTSALDGEVEAQIFAEIRDWLARRTVLVMAHRLSTVSLCPRVIVFADGRVAAEGTVAALVEASPAFERLFAEQLNQARETISVNNRS